LERLKTRKWTSCRRFASNWPQQQRRLGESTKQSFGVSPADLSVRPRRARKRPKSPSSSLLCFTAAAHQCARHACFTPRGDTLSALVYGCCRRAVVYSFNFHLMTLRLHSQLLKEALGFSHQVQCGCILYIYIFLFINRRNNFFSSMKSAASDFFM
jgi:hypothetical protein